MTFQLLSEVVSRAAMQTNESSVRVVLTLLDGGTLLPAVDSRNVVRPSTIVASNALHECGCSRGNSSEPDHMHQLG